jgi:hypothetical protein
MNSRYLRDISSVTPSADVDNVVVVDFPIKSTKGASPFDELTAALVMERHRRGELDPAILAALLAGVGPGGALMSHKPSRGGRVNAKGRNIGDGHHARLYRWMHRSPAFQRLTVGARALPAQGYDPGWPLTMRHEGAAHDSFRALPIGKWAGWTYVERDRDGLRCVHWIPRALHAGAPKSGAEQEAGTLVAQGAPTLYRALHFGLPADVDVGRP